MVAAGIVNESLPPARSTPTMTPVRSVTFTAANVATALVLRTSSVPAVWPVTISTESASGVVTTVRPMACGMSANATAVTPLRWTIPLEGVAPATSANVWVLTSACSSTVRLSASFGWPRSVPLRRPLGSKIKRSLPLAPPVRFSTPVN